MGEAAILESSDNLDGETIYTIRTSRGDELLINADRLAITVANLISEARHDRRMGWHLESGFYTDAFASINRAALRTDALTKGHSNG